MRKLARRISALIHHRRLERELAEEMAAHREMMPPERRPYFGSTLRLQEEASDHWGWTSLDHLRQDLRYGARSLLRSPAFTLTAIAVLALGIGVNLTEAHIFNAFLHRVSLRDPETAVQLSHVVRGRVLQTFSAAEMDLLRRNAASLSSIVSEAPTE